MESGGELMRDIVTMLYFGNGEKVRRDWRSGMKKRSRRHEGLGEVSIEDGKEPAAGWERWGVEDGDEAMNGVGVINWKFVAIVRG